MNGGLLLEAAFSINVASSLATPSPQRADQSDMG